MARSGVFRFDDVTVDVGTRELRRAGEAQHLEPQAFDLLVVLLDERARVVTKEELLERVWGDQFVSESALTTRIKEVRRAVGDDGTRQAVIRNLRGRGYRFVATVEEARDEHAPTAAAGPDGLFGRHDLYGRALELLGRVPVLTLVGPGGVGKTALADALAAAWAGSPDGPITVRLAAIDEPDAVVPAVQSAATISGATSDDEVAATLARLDGLLVLDNGEHLLEAVAGFVERIVRAPGPLRVVVTSRERLGVAGEQVLPVDVLSREAARALFLERATAARPDFAEDGGDPALDGILELLDDLPLAIEMAAARVSAFGLEDLHDLIAAESSVLASPHRAAPDRHRTLDDLVRWSERLLDDDSRRTMADFSVFAGPVGADDLAGVLGGEERPHPMTAVGELVDRSLVVADVDEQRPRYRMLATIRGFAARRRPSATDRDHAHWFTELAEDADRRLRTTEEAAAAARLGAITDELRAAHQWARREDPMLAIRLTGALDLYAHSRHWPEPAEWASALEPLIEDDAPGHDRVRAALAAEAAHRGDYERAVALATVAAGSDDLFTQVSAGETLSDIATYRGDLDTTVATSQRVVDLGHERGDLYAVVIGVTGLTLAAAYRGDHESGVRRLDDLRGAALAPSARAWLAYGEGECRAATDPARALRCYEEAIELATMVDNRLVSGVARVSRLALLARAGEPEQALADFETLLREYRRTGNASHSTTALRNLVDLLVRRGDDEVAMRLLGALSGDLSKVTYGDESRRLAAAREEVEARQGVDVVAGWVGATAGRGYRWALDTAIEHLAEADPGGPAT